MDCVRFPEGNGLIIIDADWSALHLRSFSVWQPLERTIDIHSKKDFPLVNPYFSDSIPFWFDFNIMHALMHEGSNEGDNATIRARELFQGRRWMDSNKATIELLICSSNRSFGGPQLTLKMLATENWTDTTLLAFAYSWMTLGRSLSVVYITWPTTLHIPTKPPRRFFTSSLLGNRLYSQQLADDKDSRLRRAMTSSEMLMQNSCAFSSNTALYLWRLRIRS